MKKPLSFFLAVLGLASSAPVRAGDATLAAKLFTEGRDAVDRGSLDEGCAKLTLSLQNEVRVGTLGKLAECEEKRGHVVAARARWQEAVALATSTNDARRAATEKELARLDQTVPRLAVHAASRVAIETLRLDGHEAPETTEPLALDPGDHVVEASAEGFSPWSGLVHLAAGSGVTVVDVPALSRSAPAFSLYADAPAPTAESQSLTAAGPLVKPKRSTTVRTIGFVTGGVGLVALGLGGYFTARAAALKGESDSAGCAGTFCPPGPATDERVGAVTNGNVATGLVIGGGVLAATGLALWIFSPRKSSAAAGVHVVPAAGSRSAGVLFGGSF